MQEGRIYTAEKAGVYCIKFVGDVRVPWCAGIDDLFASLYDRSSVERIVVDLTATEGIDSTALGMLAKLAMEFRQRFSITPVVISTNPDINRLLESMGLDNVFDITAEAEPVLASLREMPYREYTEEGMRDKVIQAHRVLMGLNEKNKETFGDLVNTLEKDKNKKS